MELTVNITANSHGSANLLHVGLVYQNFFSHVTEFANLALGQWLAAQQRLDLFFEARQSGGVESWGFSHFCCLA